MSTTELIEYTTVPQRDVSGTISLGKQLLQTVPEKPPEPLRKAVRRLRGSIAALEETWAARGANPVERTNRRLLDQRVDASWGALHGRLEAWTQLPDDSSQKSRAAAILTRVFPDGLSFLAAAHTTQWTEADKRLRQLDTEELAPSVDELAGVEFLAAVRAEHQSFGEALGILARPAEAPSAILLAEPLAEARAALRQYIVQVVATADDRDTESVAAARRVLAPVAELRAQLKQGRGGRLVEDSSDGAEVEATAPAAPAPVGDPDSPPFES